MSTKKNSRSRRRKTYIGRIIVFLGVIVALALVTIKAIAATPSRHLYYNFSTPMKEEEAIPDSRLVNVPDIDKAVEASLIEASSVSQIIDKDATVEIEKPEPPAMPSIIAESRYPEITDEERLWLMAVVTAEVGETASEAGIKGVIASVLKRVEYYGTDVFTEISRKYQYSCYDPSRGEVICYMGIAREYIQSLRTSTTPNPILAIDGEPQSGQQVVERLDRLITETIMDGAPEIRSGLNNSASQRGLAPHDEDTMFFCSAEYYYNHYADQYPIHIEVESDRTVFFVYSW